MKFKKTILLVLVFLSLLGLGTMLSNLQSRAADQLLEAYGLSNNTRFFTVQNKQSVSSFLRYLQKNYSKNKIQIHLARKGQDKQTLIWSNHNVVSLPTESGRYFTADDFKGVVSFGVLGLNAKVKTLKTQGNQYLVLKDHYYTVVGTLKHYRQMKQNGYYLTTGPEQPTGHYQLKDYNIIIDASSRVIRRVAAHYQAKIKTPYFVKSHQVHRFSVVREILLMLFFIIFAIICTIFLALLDWTVVKQTHLNGGLLRNWLINHSVRMILTEFGLALAAYFFLCWRAFLSNPQHLLGLLLLVWLLLNGTYSFSISYLSRKEKRNA